MTTIGLKRTHSEYYTSYLKEENIDIVVKYIDILSNINLISNDDIFWMELDLRLRFNNKTIFSNE